MSGTRSFRSRDRSAIASGQALVSLPARTASPARELGRRALLALALLAVTVSLVYLDRDSYTDSSDGVVSLIDAIYYATVTITTTGYGDITPVQPHARLINAIIVTPLRITFLVLLVGTTLEVLANEGRRIILDSRWRKHMRNHVVVVGFGTKGRSAVDTLVTNGQNPAAIVIIDSRAGSISEANLRGFAAIEGDATRREVLRRSEIIKAREVIITLDRDDSAILATLTVRQLNPSAHVVVAVREDDNASLLRQSGANAVVTSSEAVGRLLGLSATNPNLGTVIEDLLSSGKGWRSVSARSPRRRSGSLRRRCRASASSRWSATRPSGASTTRPWPPCRPETRSWWSVTRTRAEVAPAIDLASPGSGHPRSERSVTAVTDPATAFRGTASIDDVDAPARDRPAEAPSQSAPRTAPPTDAEESIRTGTAGLPVRLTTGPEQPRVRMRQRLARLGSTRPQTPVLDPLFTIIRANHPKADLAQVERAYRTAERHHRGQTRKSGDAYITHPLAVTTILAELGLTESTLCAALLHDTVEDTPYTLAQLTTDFGEEVALLVDGCTKVDKVSYGESAKSETIRKMVVAMARDIRVLVIKLADRLHNMRTLHYLRPDKQSRIASETLEIYARSRTGSG